MKEKERVKIVLVGSGRDCRRMRFLLTGKPYIELITLCLERDSGQFGEEDWRALKKLKELTEEEDINLIINLSSLNIHRFLKGKINILGEKQARLFLDLLQSAGGEGNSELLEELENAYEIIRRHQAEILRSEKEMEESLAELFFLHEYFKALSTSIKLSEVSHLIVDGANGILGAELSWLYLLEKDVLRFQTAQGYPEENFSSVISIEDSFEGEAIRKGILQERISKNGVCISSLKGLCLKAVYALPLRIKDQTLGVISIGFTFDRRLRPEDRDRFVSMGYVSSLALHNALLHREIERLSITDRLTGLYDHAYFQERLAQEVSNAKRYGKKVSLLMLDLDNFKKFNDTFGHPKGDQVLKRLGKILREIIREGDLAARYGGEEFVVVLPETGKERAFKVAERIRREVEKERFEGNEELPFVSQSVSIGVATFPDDALTKEELIEQADKALYRAKWAGRNKVAVAEPLSKTKESQRKDDKKLEVEKDGERKNTGS